MTDNAELKKRAENMMQSVPMGAVEVIDDLLTALSESEAEIAALKRKAALQNELFVEAVEKQVDLEAEAKRLREHDAWATVRLRRVEKAAKLVHEDASLTRLAEMERVLFGADDSEAEAEYIRAALNKEVE